MPTTKPSAHAGTTGPESLESLRAQRDRLADFIRQLAADNPQTMTLDAVTHRAALDLLDSLPMPERCPKANDGEHIFFLRTEHGTRCLACRALHPRAPLT
ncbi:hypothetical protein [Streptomyces noursei]|uniref:hypothetical protein n=1 Tax=Streptomyces noursei TaxID=1971 RepID=UPI0016735A0E|nr:hypothetical protein [Streptomyces noursei]MCZ1021427.1 hypothetical protein [Streptomyces noursei]GGX46386.1 hypothetical protein GCM10010341_80140 [Streptomyces noursei]